RLPGSAWSARMDPARSDLDGRDRDADDDARRADPGPRRVAGHEAAGDVPGALSDPDEAGCDEDEGDDGTSPMHVTSAYTMLPMGTTTQRRADPRSPPRPSRPRPPTPVKLRDCRPPTGRRPAGRNGEAAGSSSAMPRGGSGNRRRPRTRSFSS